MARTWLVSFGWRRVYYKFAVAAVTADEAVAAAEAKFGGFLRTKAGEYEPRAWRVVGDGETAVML